MNILDKIEGALFKAQEKTQTAPLNIAKKFALNQFRKSIPAKIESGKIHWQEDLDKMADAILDSTRQRSNLEEMAGITSQDIKEILQEIKGEKDGQKG